MQEISTATKNLPQTIEEKTAYVLFGSDALNAYRKKLKAIKEKFGISSEQYKQIQLEAQETAENLLLFSVDIGEEMQRIETSEGRRTDLQPHDVDDKRLKTKTETIHEMGFTDRQARDFQTLAKHPDTVQKAIEDARNEDRIVTRQDVFQKIAAQNETKRQEEARELREAKKRVENFEDSKVVTFGSVKQNTEDKKLIYEDFVEDVRKGGEAINHILYALQREGTLSAIKAADRHDLIRLQNRLQEDYRTVLKIQRKIVEVIDEKQSQ